MELFAPARRDTSNEEGRLAVYIIYLGDQSFT